MARTAPQTVAGRAARRRRGAGGRLELLAVFLAVVPVLWLALSPPES